MSRIALAIAVLARLTCSLAAIVTGVAAAGQTASRAGLHTLPDGTKAWFPRGAEVSKAWKIISFRTTDPFKAPSTPSRHSRVYLWLVPLTGGGNCFVTNGGRGIGVPVGVCLTPRQVETHSFENLASSSPGSNWLVFVGGVGVGGSRMDFFGLAKPAVAAVELRYQNLDRERLTPIDGFVLHELTPAHWKPGTRLAAAVVLNETAKQSQPSGSRRRPPASIPARSRSTTPAREPCPSRRERRAYQAFASWRQQTSEKGYEQEKPAEPCGARSGSTRARGDCHRGRRVGHEDRDSQAAHREMGRLNYGPEDIVVGPRGKVNVRDGINSFHAKFSRVTAHRLSISGIPSCSVTGRYRWTITQGERGLNHGYTLRLTKIHDACEARVGCSSPPIGGGSKA